MRISLAILLLSAFTLNTHAQTAAPKLIDWFAGADIVGSGDLNNESGINDGLNVREFEFSANSQIDHTWEGVLTLTYHNEIQLEEEHLEVHEAFLFSPKLFDGSTIKLGKFFLGFGRLNRFHRHDWIFTDAPVYHQDFFGFEGVKDTGVEYTKLAGGDWNTKATIGVTTGQEFNHVHGHDHEDEDDHEDEGSPHTPTGYIRISNFFEFTTQHGLEAGLNYVSRTDGEGTRFYYAGLDFIYKDREGRVLNNVIQAEFWSRTSHPQGDEDALEDIGGYLYYEKGLNRHHAFGFRYDFYNPEFDEHSTEEHKDVLGLHVLGNYNAYTLSYIYTNSEFMKTRVSLEHSTGLEFDEEEKEITRGLVQMVFSIGAHPAHLY